MTGTSRLQHVGKRQLLSLQHVSKRQLLCELSKVVDKDRGNTASMLAYIAEIDRRKLYLEHAYPSMFAFCTKRFHMSEAIAAKRIRAGRAAYRFPCILGMIRRGELHLSGVHQLAGHLTEGNHEEVLRRAKHRSMREIEELIAEISPKADVTSSIRALPRRRAKLPSRASQQGSTAKTAEKDTPFETSHAKPPASGDGKVVAPAPKLKSLTTPLSPRRYKLQVTIGQDARDKLAELQELLSHQIPDGDPAVVIERALDALLAETKKKKAALTDKPRAKRKKAMCTDKPQAERKKATFTDKPQAKRKNGAKRTRAIPAHIRREVFERDEGRCAFVDGGGRRCESAWQVEFHHCAPYARGGPHSTDNVELRCKAHNQYEADVEYGALFMATRRRSVSSSAREPPAR